MRGPKSPDKPTKAEIATAAAREALMARRQRQGEALRANLRRRKAAAVPGAAGDRGKRSPGSGAKNSEESR
ncbi:MAG: hypothetical protein ACI82H_001737 [Alphaproteobacteria bacterium]|jgi:hypothetical protein